MPFVPGAQLGGRRADLGSIALGMVDTGGVAWHLQALEGWDGSDLRSEYSPREADHGAWGAPVYLRQRPIVLKGKVEAPSLATLDAAVEQLIAAVALTDTTLTVYESTPKRATVRRSGSPLIQPITDRVAEYSLMVTAADPRRYSTVLQSKSTGLPSATGGLTVPVTVPFTINTTITGGAFTLVNEGSIETRPLFTITGPAAMPVIVCEQQDGTTMQLAYSDTLGTGDTLAIDTDAHTVTLNGTVSRRRYLSAQPAWPTITPGGSLAVQWTASAYHASALLTGTCRSAWM
ncbi:phage distal tail protein [Streptomyces sp. NPDC004436]